MTHALFEMRAAEKAVGEAPFTPEGMATVPQRELTPLVEELDIADSQSILFFGSRVQEELTRVSDSMLERVRAKDLGTAGDALNDMVLTLRGFDTSGLEPNRPAGWFDRLLGKGRDAAKLLQGYEKARDQIEAITARLQQHQTRLLIDIETLDRLYDANLDHFHELEVYIAAGEQKVLELDQQLIPKREQEAAHGGALAAQKLRDLRIVRDDLERRVHDLRLTRQVSMQRLPSIRLVQENDKALVGKIASTLVNTVPLWRQQLAQAVTIQRSRDAAAALTAATDLTNDMLRANAENLRHANREARKQVQRGVFDIEAVSEASRSLIAAIEDSLRIAAAGQEARATASAELDTLEQQLRQSLASVSAREHNSFAPSVQRND